MRKMAKSNMQNTPISRVRVRILVRFRVRVRFWINDMVSVRVRFRVLFSVVVFAFSHFRISHFIPPR